MSASDTQSPSHLRPKPGFLITGREDYGPRRAAMGLADQLNSLGWQSTFIALDDGPFADQLEEQGRDLVRLRLGDPGIISGSLLGRAKAFADGLAFRKKASPIIAQTLQDHGASLAHVRWPNLVGIAGHAAHSVGLPTIWQMPNIIGSGYPFDLNRRIYSLQCQRLDILPVGNSRYTAQTVGRIPKTWLHLGVDPVLFDPDAPAKITRAQVGLPDDAIVVGIFGRLHPQKGQDRVIEALGALRNHTPAVHLYLLGGPVDSPFANGLRSSAQRLGIADRVHIGGRVQDPIEHYKLLDLSINARPDPEPFGLSVVESLMMRVPILVHNLGGPGETVNDGVTGWHIHDPSPASLLDGLRRALNDRSKWSDMGRAARAEAVDQFSTPAYAKGYCRIVEQLVRDGRGSFPSEA